MTNEEAKVFMLQFNTDKRLNSSEHEAVRMAIQALEQEPILDKIRAEIEQINDTMGVSYNLYLSKIDVLAIINKYKSESEVNNEN